MDGVTNTPPEEVIVDSQYNRQFTFRIANAYLNFSVKITPDKKDLNDLYKILEKALEEVREEIIKP